MDIRERLFAAIRFQGVDRVPMSFRSSRALARRLLAYFGLEPEGGVVAAHALLDRLGADVWASGSRLGYYATFVPVYTGPRPQPPFVEDGAWFFTLGIDFVPGRVSEFGFEYPVYRNPPLARAETPSDLPPGFLMSRLALFDFGCLVNKQAPAAIAGSAGQGFDSDPLSYIGLRAANRYLICTGILNNFFMICCYLRGMEQFLMDLACNRPLAERLIGEVGEFCLEFNRRLLAACAGRVELYGAWDDVAGQGGLLFAPPLFDRYFLPLHRKLIAEVKRHGLIYSWHCCGSVHQVLPAMIDAGIDIFDVVQTSARDMDLPAMHRRYGRAVCLHGAIDVQKLLVFGTPEQVRDEVRRAHDLWGLGGGLILGPAHEAVPETPIENVLAIYQ